MSTVWAIELYVSRALWFNQELKRCQLATDEAQDSNSFNPDVTFWTSVISRGPQPTPNYQSQTGNLSGQWQDNYPPVRFAKCNFISHQPWWEIWYQEENHQSGGKKLFWSFPLVLWLVWEFCCCPIQVVYKLDQNLTLPTKRQWQELSMLLARNFVWIRTFLSDYGGIS